MNSKAALLLMLVAIVVASFLHGRKLSAKDNDMDRLADELKGIKTHLNPNIPIFLENRTQIGDLRFMGRYLLAPVITHIKENTVDTLLTISEKSDISPADSSRKILWENTDDHYRYTLTCRR